jgi:hypothetical protein
VVEVTVEGILVALGSISPVVLVQAILPIQDRWRIACFLVNKLHFEWIGKDVDLVLVAATKAFEIRF